MSSSCQTSWIISWCSKLKPEEFNQPRGYLITMLGFQILMSTYGILLLTVKDTKTFEQSLPCISNCHSTPKGLQHTALNEVILALTSMLGLS